MDTELTIQQVARQTGLSIDTLRYYERIGLLEPVGRTASGHRRYTPRDLAAIDLMICMRETGMPRAQMVRFAQLRRQGDTTLGERRVMLEHHRQGLEHHMEQLRQNMTVLQEKIARLKDREVQSASAASPMHDPGHREAAARPRDPGAKRELQTQ